MQKISKDLQSFATKEVKNNMKKVTEKLIEKNEY